MTKYSFLVAAYNCEKEIGQCLDSLLNQTLSDFEVIVLDDCSTDHTWKNLQKYKNQITLIKHSQNEGVSKTRNDLVKACQSMYFTFVDADDYVEKDLLERIDSLCDEKNEVVSFSMDLIDLEEQLVTTARKSASSSEEGQKILVEWIKQGITFDTPVGYFYLTSYFKKQKFVYAVGHQHEDFGLTPRTILKAKKMVSISDIFYHYVQTEHSITRGMDREKKWKSVSDMLYHYDDLKEFVEKQKNITEETKCYFFSYLSNRLLSRIATLEKKDQKKYKEELKKRLVVKDLLDDTWKRRLKKIYYQMRIGGIK